MEKIERLRKKLDELLEDADEIRETDLHTENLLSKVFQISSDKPEYKEIFEILILINSNKDTDLSLLSEKVYRIINKLIRNNLELVDLLEEHVAEERMKQENMTVTGVRTSSSNRPSIVEVIFGIIPTKGPAQLIFYACILCILFIILTVMGQPPGDIVNAAKTIGGK